MPAGNMANGAGYQEFTSNQCVMAISLALVAPQARKALHLSNIRRKRSQCRKEKAPIPSPHLRPNSNAAMA
jgi:hypothetical protein